MSVSPRASPRSSDKVAVFTFGRFQPPTVGHLEVFNAILAECEELNKQGGIHAEPYIYVSTTNNKDQFKVKDKEKDKDIDLQKKLEDVIEKKIKNALSSSPNPEKSSTSPKSKRQRITVYNDNGYISKDVINNLKDNNIQQLVSDKTEITPKSIKLHNPLDCDTKIQYIKLLCPTFPEKNILCNSEIMKIVPSLGRIYDKIIMVIGSDRSTFEKSFKDMATRIINNSTNLSTIEQEKAKLNASIYTNVEFKTLERDEGLIDVKGMSGTKMRTAALQDDFDFFKQGVSWLSDKDALELMNKIREAYKFPPSQIVLSQGGYKKKVAKPKAKKNKKVKTNHIMDLFRNLFVGPKKQKKKRGYKKST
jgi:hypothetical protein